MKRLPARITIVFDGTCGFCTWSVDLLDRLDRRRRVRSVPFQAPHALLGLGLTQSEAEAAAWGISPGGKRYRGAGAVNLALAVALGTRLPLVLYFLPGVRQLQDAGYAWVTRNRHLFRGVQPYCERRPGACS